MKKLIGLLLLSFICTVSKSQIVIALLFGDKLNKGKLEFGLVVSEGLTNITDIQAKAKAGLNLGIYLNFNPTKKIYLHIEGTAKGSFGAKDIAPYPIGNDSLDALLSTGTVLRKIQGFSMPVLVRYRITKLFSAEAGIQPNMRLKAHDIFKSTVNENDLEYTKNVKDEYTWLDLCVTGGVFFKFKDEKRSMGLGIRYLHGVTDIYKTKPGSQVHSAVYFSVTIPVGVGKAQAQEEKAKEQK
jgi:outer membrane protein with beta-barrel domain